MQEETDLDLSECIAVRYLELCLHAFGNSVELPPSKVAFLVKVFNDIAEKHRKEHQMVILDPDHVATFQLRPNDLGELQVCLSEREPVLFVKVHLARMVVKEGPEY